MDLLVEKGEMAHKLEYFDEQLTVIDEKVE